MSRLALILAFTLAGATAASADPANTLREFFAQLDRCMNSVELHNGTQLSIRFALKRDGSLLGKPRVTYLQEPADSHYRDEDIKAVADGFNRCLPAKITDALGGAIAGQQIVFSWLPRKREEGA